MKANVDDDELWRAATTGNGGAFATLFDRHRDRVFRHLLRFEPQPADAEDLTATVFLEMWRLRARVHLVDSSVLPWLLATATNVGRNAARARRRYKRVLEQLPPPEVSPDHAESVADQARHREAAGRVADAVGRLPLIDQQLIALTSLENYTTRQAAEAVGISPGAARTRLSRARQRLSRSVHADLTLETE